MRQFFFHTAAVTEAKFLQWALVCGAFVVCVVCVVLCYVVCVSVSKILQFTQLPQNFQKKFNPVPFLKTYFRFFFKLGRLRRWRDRHRTIFFPQQQKSECKQYEIASEEGQIHILSL